jgi:hypothetical protein
MRPKLLFVNCAFALTVLGPGSARAQTQTVRLWPGMAPGS